MRMMDHEGRALNRACNVLQRLQVRCSVLQCVVYGMNDTDKTKEQCMDKTKEESLCCIRQHNDNYILE